MEKTNTVKKKAPSRGGARKGAGRPKGSTQQITIEGLLESVKLKSNGNDYQSILVEDFLDARNRNDTHLVMKYHNLILNKVMNSLAKVEVTDSKDQIEMKQQAFAQALAKFTGIKEE